MFSDFLKNHFFIISKDNYGTIKPRLYGFVFYDSNLYVNSDICNTYINPSEAYGCFVNVTKEKNILKINQDYFGCYGLYVYETQNYWAVSNSFLYLVEHMKEEKRLHFNLSYAKAFIAQATNQLSYEETMVDEIRLLPKHAGIIIDCDSGEISIAKREQREQNIKINSKEGIELLDNWHSKWNDIINNLLSQNQSLVCDLSGGKDSRASFSILQSPAVSKIENIHFNSTDDQIYTHGDDYKIATKISQIYGFGLNQGKEATRYRMNQQENLASSMYAKCGFHKEILCTLFYYPDRRFRIMGFGGEALREHWNIDVDAFIDHEVQNNVFNSIDCNTDLRRILEKTRTQLIDDWGEECFMRNLYTNVRLRGHCGRAMIELFLSNTLILCPLMDPVLYQLDQNIGMDNDNDLLLALISSRYTPLLTDLEYDSKKTILRTNYDIARLINELYPFSIKKNSSDNKHLKIIDSNKLSPEKGNGKDLPAKQYLIEDFKSDSLRDTVEQLFGSEIYNKSLRYYNTRAYQPMIPIAALVEIYMIYIDSRQSLKKESIQESESEPTMRYWRDTYRNNGFMKDMFDFLNSARVDINCNECEGAQLFYVRSSDEKMYVEKIGRKRMILQSCASKIHITFWCKGNGNVNIGFKGPYIRDDTGAVLPIKIDFTEIVVNQGKIPLNTVLENNEIIQTDYDHPFLFDISNRSIKKYDIKLEWLPHIYEEKDFYGIMQELYEKKKQHLMFWLNQGKRYTLVRSIASLFMKKE